MSAWKDRDEGLLSEEIDEFRELYPDRPERTLAEILGSVKSALDPRPPPKMMQCAKCHQYFDTTSQWFHDKWLYPNICGSCPDVSDLLEACDEPPIRTMYCPNCGIAKNVDALYEEGLWVYAGQCSHCGQNWVNQYRLRRRCVKCGERTSVTSRNPEGKCDCESGGERPFSKKKK